jgi:hypothetical protein
MFQQKIQLSVWDTLTIRWEINAEPLRTSKIEQLQDTGLLDDDF